MDTKSLVVKGVLELTGQPDTKGPLHRYYSPAFIQHSPICADGLEGLQALTDQAKSVGARYDLLRAFGEGDLVVLHARVTGLAELPLIMFNLYRVENDKIAEHWEALTPEVGSSANGRGMADGPSEPTDLERTAENRELVRRLIEEVYIGGDHALLDGFFDAGALVQHSPAAVDGVSAVREALRPTAGGGPEVEYLKLHRILAAGNFVFTQAEGMAGGKPHAFYELFRVQDGKIAEHWEVRLEVPDQLPHGNGLF